jgi:hypothetical protein
MNASRNEPIASDASVRAATGQIGQSTRHVFFVLSILLAAALPGDSLGQCIDYDDYPQWAGAVGTPTHTQEIVIAGDYAYMTGSFPPGLLVIDISDPAAPDVVSFLEMGSWTINGLAVYQNYVYVANGSDGLQVVDVTNPATPVIVGNWDGSLSLVSDVIVYGQYLCVVGWGGLRVLDISVPASPVLVGSLDMSIDWYGGLVNAGSTLYIANGSTGLSIVSLANVTAPTLLNTVPTSGVANDVVVSGSTAYVANGAAGVAAVYVGNPATANVSWTVDTPGSARDLTLLGSYLLVADDANGLTVIDKRNGVQAVHRTLDGPGSAVAIALKDRHAFLAAQEYGIQVADITNYTGVGRLATANARVVCVDGDFAYVGENTDGLKVVDVSDPSRPRVVGSLDLQGWEPSYLTVVDGYLYWADTYDGLLIVDISVPSSPTVVGHRTLQLEQTTAFVAVQGDYAYLPQGTHGLLVLDVSDKTNPIGIRFVDTPGTAGGVVVDGSFAYVADKQMGVQILDISNPAAAAIIGNLPTSLNAVAVYRNQDTIYVHETNNFLDNQIEAFDISIPGQPVRQDSFYTSVYTRIVGFSGQFMYVSYLNSAEGYSGFAPVLMSDPYSLPDQPVPYGALGGTIANGLIYLNAFTNGLLIFPISCDATYVSPVPNPVGTLVNSGLNITSLHPNPFNPEVQITFEAEAPGPAIVEVYNVQGRLVHSRPLGLLDAGQHVATWNGTDRTGRKAPSGVYFVRLRSAGATSPSIKVVMVE